MIESQQQYGRGVVIRQVSKPPHLKRAGNYWLIRCECGNECIVDSTTLRKKWKSCGCIQEENLVGKTFGNGTVTSLTGQNNGRRIWSVQCACGNIYKARTESLTSGNTKSCGCLSKRTGAKHPHYKGHQDISKNYWTKLKRGASNRKIVFLISIEDAWKLYESQQGRCKLSGWEISLKKPQTASLDRINSKKPYTLGNVQWVHKDINRMKQHYTQEYFLSACRAITENGGSH